MGTERELHIDLLCRTEGRPMDAIRDHTHLLAAALAEHVGVTAKVHDLGGTVDRRRELADAVTPGIAGHHVVLVQYNPFSYGRWGCAPWLLDALRRLRSAHPGTAIFLLAHELFVEFGGLRTSAQATVQRLQFAALRRLSDRVFTTTDAFALRAGGRSTDPADVLPVGSNLPDRRRSRAACRRTLRVVDGEVVIGLLGTGHWSRMFDLSAATVEQLASRQRLTVLNLGHGAPELAVGHDHLTVKTPGSLSAGDLSDQLAAVDLLLLPFVDGASTRRTTLMAGLQHGLPILSTDGPSTGPLLRGSSAMQLISVEDADIRFADEAQRLLEDSPRRAALGHAARNLYEEHFAWPIIAGRLLGLVDVALARRH